MKRNVVISPLKSFSGEYDCLVATAGFETRSRYFAENRQPSATVKVAAAFTERQVLAFPANVQFFNDAGFRVEEVSDDAFLEWSRALVGSLTPNEEESLRLCVDISSMSRVRLATLVEVIRKAQHRCPIEVDFVYSAAMYSPPPAESVPNSAFGPVLPGFAGWSAEPDQPTSVIVGLGYEQDRAIGAVEHINPAEVWSFKPVGHQVKYARAVEMANSQLWEWVHPNRQLSYDVFSPFDCFVQVESLASGAKRSRKVILLPFGPKIFALACLLVACVHPELSVWRVSSEQRENPTDRRPNRKIIGLSVSFGLLGQGTLEQTGAVACADH